MKTGVYIIRNVVDGKVYVGSTTKSFSHRWGMHISDLVKGCHANQYLQRAWNKYGHQSFDIRILEQCSKEQCLEREQYWMDYFQSYKRIKGYNINEKAASRLGMKNQLGIKSKWKEIFVFLTDGTRIGWYPSTCHAAIGLFNDQSKNKLIWSCITGLKKSYKGHVFSLKDRFPGYNIDHSRPSFQHTKETRQRMSTLRSGKARPEIMIPVVQKTLDDTIIQRWPSTTTAANSLQITRSNINAALKNKRSSAGGFKWAYDYDGDT